MSSFSLRTQIEIILTAALIFLAVFLNYKIQSRKSLKRSSDKYAKIQLINVDNNKQKYYGKVRYRQYTFKPNGDWNSNVINTKLILFVSDIGDALNIWDSMMNKIYDSIYYDNKLNKHVCHLIAFDRLCYGESSGISDNSLCISPPKFNDITAYERALELLQFIKYLQDKLEYFDIKQSEIVLIGQGYGTLIINSLLYILYYDSKMYGNNNNGSILGIHNDIFDGNRIKCLFLNPIDLDTPYMNYTNKLNAYLDYILTIFYLKQPNHYYPNLNDLSNSNHDNLNDMINDIATCKQYRTFGNHVIGIWNERFGFNDSINIFKTKGIDKEYINYKDGLTINWFNTLKKFQINTKIALQIGILYSENNTFNWNDFKQTLILFNKKVINSQWYTHFDAPNIVLENLLSMLKK